MSDTQNIGKKKPRPSLLVKSDYSESSTRFDQCVEIVSPTSARNAHHIDKLVSFLTQFVDVLESHPAKKQEFEELTTQVLNETADQELITILKDCGWNGVNYIKQNDFFDSNYCLQALMNYYLKITTINIRPKDKFKPNNFELLYPYVPDYLLNMIRIDFKMKLKQPLSVSINGACMLADISGFSKYSGEMCSNGIAGLDILRNVTDGFLGDLVSVIYDYGGDVISFAGDALICLFPESTDINRNECCLNALLCANKLRTLEIDRLSTHIAVTYGSMNFSFLGGANNQWIYILTGGCIHDLTSCIEDAGSKEVTCSPSCYSQLNQDSRALFKIKEKPSKNMVINLISKEIIEPRKILDNSAIKRSKSMASNNTLAGQIEKSSMRYVLNLLSQFAPAPIKNSLSNESNEAIGEIRHVTTMFLSLDSFSKQKHASNPLLLQPFFFKAQEILHHCGGFLRQFLVDDKGCVLIAMWGVPSFTYANSALRALYCASAIMSESKLLDHRCSIGITTGMVYCGSIGAKYRKDYVCIGTDVNIAARLMSKANGHILIDPKTYSFLSSSAKGLLIEYKPLQLKGLSVPLQPYMYQSEELPNLEEYNEEQEGPKLLLPIEIINKINDHLDKFSNFSQELTLESSESTVFLSSLPSSPTTPIFSNYPPSNPQDSKSILAFLGASGTGKSAASQYFRSSAHKRKIPCLTIEITQKHSGTPYGVIRDLLCSLVGQDPNKEFDQRGKGYILYLINQTFPDLPENKYNSYISVFDKVFHFKWSESLDSSPQGSMEYNSLKSFHQTGPESKSIFEFYQFEEYVMSEIIVNKLKETPKALVLQNAHFCDELSWKVLQSVYDHSECRLSLLLTFQLKGIEIEKSSKTHQLQRYREQKELKEQKEMRESSPLRCEENPHEDEIHTRPNLSPTTSIKSDFSLDSSDQSTSLIHSDDSKAISMPTPTRTSITPTFDFALEDKKLLTKNIIKPLPFTCLSLLMQPNCDIIKLHNLTLEEVKSLLLEIVGPEKATEALVTEVYKLTSGNPFWCKNLSQFLQQDARLNYNDLTTEENPLTVLILTRYEKLSNLHRYILRLASIIGLQFSEDLLASIANMDRKMLRTKLNDLVSDNFFRLIESDSERKYEFQNPLIQSTVTNSIPPRDAAEYHLAIANFYEVKYIDNLRPYYYLLGNHYKHAIDRQNPECEVRGEAFKYLLKAADQAMSQGAFHDGLGFVRECLGIVELKAEYDLISELIDLALDCMKYVDKTPAGLSKKLIADYNLLNHDYQSVKDYLITSKTLKFSIKKKTKPSVPRPKKMFTKVVNALKFSELPPKLDKRSESKRLDYQLSYLTKVKTAESDESRESFLASSFSSSLNSESQYQSSSTSTDPTKSHRNINSVSPLAKATTLSEMNFRNSDPSFESFSLTRTTASNLDDILPVSDHHDLFDFDELPEAEILESSLSPHDTHSHPNQSQHPHHHKDKDCVIS